MKNRRTLMSVTLASFALACAVAGGCANSQCADETEDAAKCAAPKPGTITTANTMCAVNPNDPVDPSLTGVEWKGQKIGFCCKGCIPRWNKMTDAQKDAAVAKVVPAR